MAKNNFGAPGAKKKHSTKRASGPASAGYSPSRPKKAHRKGFGVDSAGAGERKPRHGQVNRAERRAAQFDGQDRPRRYEKDYAAETGRGRFTDSHRPERTGGSSRPGYGRDERGGSRYERRDDRFAGGDRQDRFERGDRQDRFDRRDRNDRFERRDAHSDRGRPPFVRSERFDRNDRPDRLDRSERGGRRFERDDFRGERRFERDDFRGDRRPGGERTGYSDRPQRRPHEHAPAPHRRHVAGHSDFRRQDRDDRAGRSQYLSRADEEAAFEGAIDELAPVETKAAVEVGEQNEFTAMGIPDPMVKILAERGIGAPFAIQVEAIPTALTGADVLARAATGSGKTLAFGLPTLTRLAGGTREPQRPRALVLAPTRELAMQVVEALAPLGRAMGLRTLLVAGGMPYKKQLDQLANGVDLLIATPGRLIDLIERGAADLSGVEISVLDEADQMCDMGFAPEVRRILEETPTTGQRMLFSATLDGDVDVLVKRFLTDPVRHSTADVGASVESMEHRLFVVHPGRKAAVAAELASRPGRSIVFVRTKMGADRVAEKMREVGVNALAIHGGLSQGQRTRALNAFRGNDVPVLVATDVAARGIHIDDVELVIQADPPQEHKTYLHRAGRTARAGEEGTVVMLAMPRERRGAERLIERAGVSLRGVYVEPGDMAITEITGGATPSGEPVEEFRPPVKTRAPRGRGYGGGRRNDGGFRRHGGERPAEGGYRRGGGDARSDRGYRDSGRPRNNDGPRGRRPERQFSDRPQRYDA